MNYSNNSSNTCNGTKYVIKKGDTLYSISRRYNVPLALVLRANPYVDVYNLQVGDEICIPMEQESSVPTRPPVITGPGPVIVPQNENIESVREETAEEPETEVVPEETVRTAPTTVVQPQVSTQPQVPTQPARREIGSRNTFNIHYYNNGASAPSNEVEETRKTATTQKGMTQRLTQPMTPARPAAPARRTTQVRQTMPARQTESIPEHQAMPERRRMPERQTMPVRQAMPEVMPEMEREPVPTRMVMPVPQRPVVSRTITKARMVAPVRIIAQPAMEEEHGRCDKWNCYQDRERFNSIMYNTDKMRSDCCSRKCPSICTENIAKSKPCYDDDETENITIISYICRDEDSLQDIMDYFTIDMNELLQYNIPNNIKLKPGCMIQLPGKGDDM